MQSPQIGLRTMEGLCADWQFPPKADGSALAEILAEIRSIDLTEKRSIAEDPFYPRVRAFSESLSAVLHPGRRVLVSCDYDVDGVVSGIIFAAILKAVGAIPIIFIPDRFADGYGVSIEAIKQESAVEPFHAILTTDCGSASLVDLHAFSKDAGVPIFVVDHHHGSVSDVERAQLEGCPVELNPTNYPDLNPTHYCAGTLALMVATALADSHSLVQDILPTLVELGGFAALADVSSSRGVANRVAMRQLLQVGAVSKNHGLKVLFDRAGVSGNCSATDVTFRLAPLINAAGRIQHASLAFQLFDSPTASEASAVYDQLRALNLKRQSLERSVVAEALQRHRESPSVGCLVAWSSDWHPGVVGPAAGKVAEALNIPVLLGAEIAQRGRITFSGRTAQGINLLALVTDAADGLGLSFGGHAAAMGLSASDDVDGLDALTKLTERLAGSPVKAGSRRLCKIDRFLSAPTVSWRNFKEVCRLEPWDSLNNRPPIFCIPNLQLTLSPVGSDNSSVKGVAEDAEGYSFPVVSFRNPTVSKLRSFKGHVVGEFIRSTYRNNETLQILIHDVVPN